MAQVIGDGKRKRGRKPGSLRLAVAALASKLAPAGKLTDVTVEVAPPKSARSKPETVTFAVPKGSVVVPPELTRDKSDANVRAQVVSGVNDFERARTGKDDATLPVSIASVLIRTYDAVEFPVFYVTLK